MIDPAQLAWLRKPQFLIPIGVVVLMVIVAFAVQPGGSAEGQTTDGTDVNILADGTPTASATATQSAAATPSPTASPAASKTAIASPSAGTTVAANGSPTVTSDIAAARATPSPTPGPDLSRQVNECGTVDESAMNLSVEQSINSISVKATRAATYPIEYFRCIMMATGTQESFSLANAISKAQDGGSTHAVLIDLWVTNAGRDFGQLSMKDATVAAAGQTFAPIATLGGRADVVIASGQGRTVTLVIAVKNTVGDGVGPMTLTLPAPLAGGQPTAGKYSLFLPTK
jgi:hypothetical protein